MKKYIICFSLFCYFLYSNVAVVSASEIDNEILIEENIDIPDMPMVHDNYDTYSVGVGALGLGSLGSGALGGVLGGVGVVVGGLLGAGALALGGYVVGKGLYNVYNQVKNWVMTQSQVDALDMELSYSSNGDLLVNVTDVPQDLVQSLGNSMSYETNKGLFSTLNTQWSFTKTVTAYIYMPQGVVYESHGGNCGYATCYAVTNGAYQYYYEGVNYYLTNFRFKTYSSRGNPNGSTSFEGYGYFYDKSLGKYIPFDSYKIFSSGMDNIFSYSTTINSEYYYSSDKFFTTVGLNYVTTEQMNSLILQSLSSSVALEIPKDYIGVANPGFTWNGQTWVNSSGESVSPNDVVTPFPDMFNPSTGEWGFSDTIADSMGGTVTTPDTSVPDTGTGWLSSVLNAIKSLPSSIASAFTGMIDNIINAVKSIPSAFTGVLSSISSTMDKTWEWCQGLPNLLGDLLGALGSAIVDGLTVAFGGVVSGVQTIVNFINGILSFIMSLVVPVEGFFVDELAELGDIFTAKMPFFGQIGDIIKAFKFDINAPMPEFKITVPKHYGGGTYHIINFANFVAYRNNILNLIRLFTWIPFVMRIYKKSIYMATGH